MSSEIQLTNELIRGAEWFKQESLRALGYSLSQRNYPGYPLERYFDQQGSLGAELPAGPWEFNGTPLPNATEQQELAARGIVFDAIGRPIHPWAANMLADPLIGLVTGKGFYWNWGPNDTADPIIVRHDLDEPHVLLIERGDGTGWALPGGFKNKGEPSKEAAVREGREETGIDVSQLPHSVRQIYQGPLADLRVTAHAWPETSAFCFELDLSSKETLKLLADMMATSRTQRLVRHIGRFAFTDHLSRVPWKGGDDAKKAKWVPLSKISSQLFGSHKLLIDMALS